MSDEVRDYDAGDAIEPDLDDVLQETSDLPAVVVRQAGPVRTHELPTRRAYTRNVNVTDAVDQVALEQIAAEDLTRKYLYVSVTGAPCYVGHDRGDVAAGISGILPVGLMLPLPTGAPVWVRSASAGVTAVLSWWAGNWAD